MNNQQTITPEDTFYYAKLSQLGIEEWLPVPGYEGKYEVSNLGNARSLDRFINHNRPGLKRFVKGKSLGSMRSTARIGVYLQRKCIELHKLIALVFYGEANGLQVRHLNGTPTDNRLFNLKYGTAKENADDREKHGRTAKGKKNGSCKTSESDVLQIRELATLGTPRKIIAKRFGLELSTVRKIINYQLWKHLH